MAMQYYTETGTPDLIGISNANFKSIDGAMNGISSDLNAVKQQLTALTNRVTSLESTKPVISESDTGLTVKGLNNVKVSASGFLYYKNA